MSAARAADVAAAIDAAGSPERAQSSAGFFKTGPGEYGEGDRFAGVSVPEQRRIAKRFRGIAPGEIRRLLSSGVHEHRLTALLMLVWEYEHAGDVAARRVWLDLYLEQVRAGRVNNWDLVDSSAAQIVGTSVADGESPVSLITELAAEDDLWRRRVGIIATFAFLTRAEPGPLTGDVAPLVIGDRRDLIQKAFGWMLRELGKRCNRDLLIAYLDAHAAAMGRTALSYATEHLTKEQRAHYRSLK
ncbi:DNA alkylation repair protein [Jongsikchunia kroppenstedtii]|uniref:DNA alkylation repair protein n=1 Tax=Jongsikchunia kroppenstedtii TaxID=1121721 RepID=UPI00036B0D80|nr:DNA alkylation repair protein [Jongsikchunia kroppenstedtii]